MSVVLQESVADALRGDPRQRPPVDHALADHLRVVVDDVARSAVGAGPRHVSASRLRVAPRRTDDAPAARLRGTLVTELLELAVVGFGITDPFEDAYAAWRAHTNVDALREYADQLSADDRARLATDVDAHGVTLLQRLGTVSPKWLPRTGVRVALPFAGGAVICHDVIDLAVGGPSAATASVALLDVTTGDLDEDTDRVLHYHALCELLRTSVAPVRVLGLSTATGEVATLEVTPDVLTAACHDLTTVLAVPR
jgi:hypothetical protein